MSRQYASEFLSFVNASPSPYHAVQTAKNRLVKAGFVEISEREPWENKLEPGNKYFLTRNGSSIVAFGIGGKWKPGNGIAIIGAHTDSPTFRVKPKSNKTTAGYLQVGVETYGGGLWHTWFDRDLSVAGRVYVKDGSRYVPKLVKIDKPLLRIPTLAIHLDREVNSKLEFNKEQQLVPVLGLVESELNGKDASPKEESGEFNSLGKIQDRHHPALLQLIAKDLNAKVEDIQDFELVLYDTQGSVVGGINDEFVFSPRLDNLCSSYASIEGLLNSLEDPSSLANDESIRMVCLFDHEEIGSSSAQGADSNLLEAVITRLAAGQLKGDESSSRLGHASMAYETYAKSFLISADMAHGIHPNYEAKHETLHRPALNKGPVIKVNANQRYATNSPGILMVQNAANMGNTPLQLFVVRNDSPCGSTIGPILASKLGMRTLDIGNPQLSMHSCREMCGSADIGYAVDLFTNFLANYTAIDKAVPIEDADL